MHTGSIEFSWILLRLIYLALEKTPFMFFHWIILDTYEILRGRVADRVVKFDSINVCTPKASIFPDSAAAHLSCAKKYIICVFLPHIYVCFSMNYSWQPICGVKEASGEKNFTHFLLDYVWSVGNCILFLVGTTLSWRTIHDLAIATFWQVG